MNKNKSFTLIELLVVIVIIGILAGVIMISTSSSIDKASFAKAQAFSSTVQEELLSNLVSEWAFNEPEVSGKTLDSWGNNDGTIIGAVYRDNTANKCVFGGCYEFNGSSSYIDLGSDILISQTNQGWTAMYWINSVDTSLIQHVNSAEADDFNANWLAIYNRKLAVWNVDPGYWKYGSTIFENNKWYQIVFVCDPGGTKYRFYVNGGTEAGDHVNNVWSPAYSALKVRYIGRYEYAGSYSRYFKGQIDDVRVYSEALSSSQIKQNYIAGLNSMLSNGSISKQEYNERINTLAYE